MRKTYPTLATLTCAAALTFLVHGGDSAAQETSTEQTLQTCEATLPEGKQYNMTITLDVDTRTGQQSTLSAMLLDNATPQSMEVPPGTEDYIRCILGLLGVPASEI